MLDDLGRVGEGRVGDDAEDPGVLHGLDRQKIASVADVGPIGFKACGSRRSDDRPGAAATIPNCPRELLDGEQAFAAPDRLDIQVVLLLPRAS